MPEVEIWDSQYCYLDFAASWRYLNASTKKRSAKVEVYLSMDEYSSGCSIASITSSVESEDMEGIKE